LNGQDKSVIDLITQMKESLERQIEGVERHMAAGFATLGTKIDAAHARMERQAGMLRAGQINLVRLNEWSEKMDSLLAVRDKRIDELEARLRKLENGSSA
jgi:hypothetical protein